MMAGMFYNFKQLSRYFVSDIIAVVVIRLTTVPAAEPQVSCVFCSRLALQEAPQDCVESSRELAPLDSSISCGGVFLIIL